MGLSYGEMVALQDDWKQYRRHLFDNKPADGLMPVEDIEKYIDSISDVYCTEEEQDEVMLFIQGLEMDEAGIY